MDVVLEVADAFVADYVYAWALPARPAPYDFPKPTSNATDQAVSTWQYKPSTWIFSIEPSQAAYMSAWPRDHPVRQYITLFFITWIFGLVIYFIFSTLSYVFIFDKKTKQHPKYLRNQIWLEIKQASWSMPGMAIPTAALFVADVRGLGKMYSTSADGPGLWYDVLQFPLFLVFTDFWIYWIHRWLHHPLIYKHLHKPHHKWIMPTPYASYAFHPLDGFAQSVPYHVFPFIFPMHKLAFLFLFVGVNFWTVVIHDGEFISNNPIVNGAACHSVHHLAFNYNYGQYTTIWDRLGGSYRKPAPEMFQKEVKMSTATWKKQIAEMERIVKEVEGEDDRVYTPDEPKKTI